MLLPLNSNTYRLKFLNPIAHMLRKMPTRQIDGEPQRLWLTDDYFDLFLYYHPDGTISGFQLCYAKQTNEKSITWLGSGMPRHEGVDVGEDSPLKSRSPVMARAHVFRREPMRTEFVKRSAELEPEIRDLILSKIDAVPTVRKQ